MSALSPPPQMGDRSKFPSNAASTNTNPNSRYVPAAVSAFGASTLLSNRTPPPSSSSSNNNNLIGGVSPIASSLATGQQHRDAANAYTSSNNTAHTTTRIPADRSFTQHLNNNNNNNNNNTTTYV